MLTKDLLRARAYKDQVRPSLIKIDDPNLLSFADDIITRFRQGLKSGVRRGELGKMIKEAIGLSRDAKLLAGIGRVLLNRCEFETRAPIDPKILRAQLFALAAEQGPLSLTAGPFGHTTAEDIFTTVAIEHNTTATALREAMFADRKDQAVITKLRCKDATWLLHRYNVALVQGILLHCKRLVVEVEDPTPARVRQLLRFAKFYQLIHRVQRNGKLLSVTLDGPTSVLNQSTRYGMALANFFPAILLQKKTWRVEGELLWGKPAKSRVVSINNGHNLRSHYPDTGMQVSQEATWLGERFQTLKSDWSIDAAKRPLRLGPDAVIMPDFTFRRGENEVHIEILGYWRKATLQSRLLLLKKHAPNNLILAVSDRLRADKGTLLDLPLQVITFKGVIPAKKVLALLNSMVAT
jgi:predicted nuclease of restriction endonuclease-like RecB superfamily